jgi:uncharacterized RDD family membrane protein YckC
MLDTPRVVTTPEGIELILNVAGPVARARAWLIDMLVRGVLFIILLTIFSALGKFGAGLSLLTWFLLEWAYPILFEVFWKGATPGKRACHLRVLHDDGTPVGWRASITRNTLRTVDFLPFIYGCGLIACLLNRDFKRLGDLAAGTVVIYLERAPNRVIASRAIELTPPMDQLADAALLAIPLRLPEQRAIIHFAERRSRWSDQRAAELAEHAKFLLGDKSGLGAVDRLISLARQITGEHSTKLINKVRR